jgi:hypothetical protein
VKGEPFEKIPRRLADAMEDGELSDRQAAFLLFIWLRRNHLTNKLRVTTARLKEQRPEYGSAATLVRDLHALHEAGWLEFAPRPGQRKPHDLRLGWRALGEEPPSAAQRPLHDLCTTSAPSAPDSAEVPSAALIDVPLGVPLPEPEDGAFQPPHWPAFRDTRHETRDKPVQTAASSRLRPPVESVEEADPPGLAEALARIEDEQGQRLLGQGRRAARIGWRDAPKRVEELIEEARSRGRESPLGLLSQMLFCGDAARPRVDHPPASEETDRAEEEWEAYAEDGEWLYRGNGSCSALGLLLSELDAGERYGPVTAEGRDAIQRIAWRKIHHVEQGR